MIGDDDLDSIFESGDFDVAATFGGTLTVKGWFTPASQGVAMLNGLDVEAGKPSFTCPTAAIATLANKTAAVINGDNYVVERVEPCGNGVSVVWLKESNA